MDVGGWILMLGSWAVISGLAGFCLLKVLRGPS